MKTYGDVTEVVKT